VVGPSGAGKSSIVQIVLRLRDPHAGAVLVNGTDARTIRRSDWQRKVAYVPQASRLIWGTVRENIRFYRDWIDDEDVVAAAKRAHIHDEILSWPSGYDTVIGQRASAVSGGQGQRICLARALAGRPQVLVLDEPTSALDVRSEELVQRSLQEIKHDTLTILVAHRLSTLAVCDRIVVMVDGRVSAVGPHATLVDNNDFYRQVTRITQRQSAAGSRLRSARPRPCCQRRQPADDLSGRDCYHCSGGVLAIVRQGEKEGGRTCGLRELPGGPVCLNAR